MAATATSVTAHLAKLSLGKRLLLLAAVLTALGLLYWKVVYAGLAEEVSRAARKEKRLRDERAELDDKMKTIKELEARFGQLRRVLDGIELALPTEPELPSFIHHLQVKAGEAGVSFKSWTRGKDEAVDTFVKVRMDVEVAGSFYQLMRYFSLLGSEEGAANEVGAAAADAVHRRFERIVSIENLQITAPSVRSGEVHLTAKFTASTFHKGLPAEAGAERGGRAQPAAGVPGAARSPRRGGDAETGLGSES